MVDWVKTEKEIDKRIAERCVTHHHACDCREYAFRQRIEALEAENQRLKEIGGQLLGPNECCCELGIGNPMATAHSLPCMMLREALLPGRGGTKPKIDYGPNEV